MKKDIIGTAPEERFDVLTKEASERLTCPISTVSIIDNDREWYKSVVGLNEKQAPIAASFCVHAMKAKSVFLVEDTLNDPRFVNNPMVVNPPKIRAYAGVALYDRKSEMPLGAFCVKDIKPRKFTVEEIDALVDIASRVEDELNK